MEKWIVNNLMVIDGITVRSDAQARYCLNDLHRAAGGEERHKPSNFLRMDSTRKLDRFSYITREDLENKGRAAGADRHRAGDYVTRIFVEKC